MSKLDKSVFLEDINLLGGWGIFLVVIGHLPFLEWCSPYLAVRKVIYSFHMPLFMVISGYLFVRFSKNKIKDQHDYFRFILKKALRFIPAYVFTTILIFLFKLLLDKVILLKHPVTLESFFMMFINPKDDGFVIHLWFIYTLFFIFLIYPLLEKVMQHFNWQVRLFVYFVLSLVSVTHLFCLNLVCHYLFYFHLGASVNQLKFSLGTGKSWGISAGLFFLMLLGNLLVDLSQGIFVFNNLAIFLTAIFGMAFSYTLTAWLVKSHNMIRTFFNFIGLFSFEIYLFHLLGSETGGYILKFIFTDTRVFIFMNIIFSTILGLIIPVFLTKALMKWFSPVARVMFGR